MADAPRIVQFAMRRSGPEKMSDARRDMTVSRLVRTAQSCAIDPRIAVRELHESLNQPDIELVLFFCSSRYDLDVLGDELRRRFGQTQVVGCSSAGEIGPKGYREHSIVGVSFPTGPFMAVTARLDRLGGFDAMRDSEVVQSQLTQLLTHDRAAALSNRCALLLIDGLSMREERVAHALQGILGPIPLVGGSAGDDLRFRATSVYHDGRFHAESAVLTLLATNAPMTLLKTQHFRAGSERLVVTAADSDRRIVKELNGQPAAQAYAELLGVDASELTPDLFITSPLIVMIDNSIFVRSVQRTDPDGSLTFYCAIEEGMVLRRAHSIDLVSNLTQSFTDAGLSVGDPQLVIGYDCVLRRLEVQRRGLDSPVNDVFRRNNVVGFATYGEQFRGMHINQTFTGLAIGMPRGDKNV